VPSRIVARLCAKYSTAWKEFEDSGPERPLAYDHEPSTQGVNYSWNFTGIELPQIVIFPDIVISLQDVARAVGIDRTGVCAGAIKLRVVGIASVWHACDRVSA
jgi:hypothetical protein